MAGQFGGLGATTYSWRSDVDNVVHKVLRRFDEVSANSYVAHPWPGWSRVSVDFWGKGGRGDPIGRRTGYLVRDFLMELPGRPHIRHTIYEHELWTSWGGTTRWHQDDHSGELRHVHVTYWR